MATAKVTLSPTSVSRCDSARAFSALHMQQCIMSANVQQETKLLLSRTHQTTATETLHSQQQQLEEAHMYNQLFNATYDAQKKNSGSSMIIEFLKQLKWGSNIMNCSVPSNLLSGLSLLETTARTNAPTSSLLL